MIYSTQYNTSFNLQKTHKFQEIWTKLQMSKFEETFSVFRKFLSLLRLASMLYIKYIRKIFDWSKNE